MSTNEIPPQAGEPVFIDRAVHVPLHEQKNPHLGDHLDAKEFDIKNVGNIEAKTFNGINLIAWAGQLTDTILQATAKYCAPRAHTHDEFDQIRKEIDDKIAAAKPTETYATDDHVHSIDEVTGTVPLSRVQRGDELQTLLTQHFAPVIHTHPELASLIAALSDRLVKLENALTLFVKQEQLSAVSVAVSDAERAFRTELDRIREELPKPAPQDVELLAMRRVQIPRKADGKTIDEIVGRDDNGFPINVTVTKAGVAIKTGDKVSVDDILAISPPTALVRIRLV